MKKFLFFIFLSPFTLNAQEIYDLKRCLETGLERNYDIRLIRNTQQISDNNVTWGNAGFLPSLDLSAGYSGSLNNTRQNYADGTTGSDSGILNQGANLGLNLNWTLFDGFAMQTNYERLKEFRNLGELNVRRAIEDFISGLTAEYYNYVHQNLRLGNLKYAVSLSKERLRVVEARYNMGSMSRLDLQQAMVDFNADSSSLIRQYEVVYTSGVKLNQLMAVDDVSQTLLVPDTLINLNSFLEKDRLWELTLRTNSQLLLSAKNKLISDLDYKNLKGRDYPYLRFNAGYGYTLNTYGSGSTNRQQNLGLNYGFTLGFNIFDGLNRQREKKNAQLTIRNRELQQEQMELSLKADLSNMWMAYRNNLNLINLEKENMVSAHENYDIAMDRYRLGDLAGIELREAQNSLLSAEERLLQAQFNTKLCEISLMLISGQVDSYLK
jgi:outer membrane protein TolC